MLVSTGSTLSTQGKDSNNSPNSIAFLWSSSKRVTLFSKAYNPAAAK